MHVAHHDPSTRRPLAWLDARHAAVPALWANAAFSALTGLALLFAAPQLAPMLDLPAWLCRSLGTSLLGFAALVAWVSRDPRPGWVLLISLADLAWVAGSAVWVLVDTTKLALVGGCALAVLGLALGQLRGIRRSAQKPRPDLGRWRHRVVVDVPVPATQIWPVIARLGDIARFMPSLANSEIKGASEPKVGAVRACTDHRGARWEEEVTQWRPEGMQFTLRFRDELPDFPFPAEQMWGGWAVAPTPGGAKVMVWWSLTPSVRVLPWLVIPVMSLAVDGSIRGVITRMAEEAGRGTGAAGTAKE